MNIEGRNALVTGAAGGIGRATALMLAERGAAKIAIVDVNTQALAELAEEIRRAGALPIVKPADLTKPSEVARVFAEADAETGGLDIVHNNAGRMSGPPDFPDTPYESLVATINLNLMAVMVGTHLSIQQMRKRSAPGVIVNTSSMAAFNALPPDPAYSATKIAIINFTQACKSLSERYGVRVMAVCPGIVDTAIIQREAPWLKAALSMITMLAPNDIAKAVCDVILDDSKAGEYVVVEHGPKG